MSDLNLTTMNDVFRLVTGRGDKTAMLYKDGREWKPISSAELYGRVRALADALKNWGVGKGDRVVLVSENRWEWQVTDFAAVALGAVSVPLYPTLTPDQIGYMLRDSAAKVAVLSTKQQYEKLTKAGEFPDLDHVVVMDAGEFSGAESFAKLMTGAEGKQQPEEAFDKAAAESKPDDLATIIYTSGTTGEPKGVMLTHGNLASNLVYSTTPFEFGEGDACISFLPLSHVTARHLDYALMARGSTIAYCSKVDYLKDAMAQVKPTIFVAVPRLYEKIRQGVECKSTGFKAKVLRWALKVGKRHREETLRGVTPRGLDWKLADKLVFSKIRTAFGGHARIFVSGGAPLGMDSAGWFADVGIRIFEGYGLTETSPVIALNYPDAHRIGTVGKVLKNVQVRFAEDEELEVHGPSIFKGYWKKDKETAEAFTADGWFKTGDIGKLDADGYLSITDRKKELIKTSGGKFIAPQPIENKLKANQFVAHAAMVGDKRKFASVLISPNFEALTGWAKGQGVNTADHGKMVKDAKVIALYKNIVDGVNKDLAHFETMKKIVVVPDEWSVEDDMLTPSMKLKRRMVAQKYKKEIDGFYGGESEEDTAAGKEQKKVRLWRAIGVALLACGVSAAQAPVQPGVNGPPACASEAKPSIAVASVAKRRNAEAALAVEKASAAQAGVLVALPPLENLDIARARIADYADCVGTEGCYWTDLDAATARAATALDGLIAARKDGEKTAIIFDIDDTTLSSYCEMKREDFGYIDEMFNAWVVTPDAAALPIAGSVRLFRQAKAAGMSVFFITGRPDSQRRATERNLRTAGYDGWEYLAMRDEAEIKLPSQEYKSLERKKIVGEGYRLLMNVGDQWSDLNGEPRAEVSVKLPNPFYFLP